MVLCCSIPTQFALIIMEHMAENIIVESILMAVTVRMVIAVNKIKVSIYHPDRDFSVRMVFYMPIYDII